MYLYENILILLYQDVSTFWHLDCQVIEDLKMPCRHYTSSCLAFELKIINLTITIWISNSIRFLSEKPGYVSNPVCRSVDFWFNQNITVFMLGFFLTLAKPLSYFEIVYHLNYCHSSRPMLCLLCHLHALKVAEAISFMWFMCINCIWCVLTTL